MTDSPASGDKYVRGVSFDTMTDKDLPNYSFTLCGKTPGYKRSRRSRTFMLATDLADYSEYALNWASEEIMDDGDELIVLRVVTVDMNDKKTNVQLVLERESKESSEKANTVMEKIMNSSSPEKKISVIIEFVIGKVQETIQHTIAMYQPSLLIVGTRGLTEFQGMLLGSVSKYCLQHSPVPVAVVRPDKVKKYKMRRPRFNLKRLGSSTNVSKANSSGESSSDEEPSRLNKRLSRLSLRSRSNSPSPSPSNNKNRSS